MCHALASIRILKMFFIVFLQKQEWPWLIGLVYWLKQYFSTNILIPIKGTTIYLAAYFICLQTCYWIPWNSMLKDVYQKSIKEASTEGSCKYLDETITSLAYNLQRWWLGTLFIPNEGKFDGPLWIFTFIPSLLAPLIDEHYLEIIRI